MTKVVFIDQVGRTILGDEVSRDLKTLVVKNPAMINVNQAQGGQLQVQLFPLFFAEFIESAARSTGTVWEFNRDQITLGQDVPVDERLINQYKQVFGLPVPAAEPPTIKLFDE